VAAKSNLDLWRKPPKLVAVVVLHQKSGLRQVHLRRHILEPTIVLPRRQWNDGCRVTGKGPVIERINDKAAWSQRRHQ
jgi:hypothetical protein